jgi:hypothetical protein
LAHREFPRVTGSTVGVGEWVRDAIDPAREERLDVGWAEPMTDRLQPVGTLMESFWGSMQIEL